MDAMIVSLEIPDIVRKLLGWLFLGFKILVTVAGIVGGLAITLLTGPLFMNGLNTNDSLVFIVAVSGASAFLTTGKFVFFSRIHRGGAFKGFGEWKNAYPII